MCCSHRCVSLHKHYLTHDALARFRVPVSICYSNGTCYASSITCRSLMFSMCVFLLSLSRVNVFHVSFISYHLLSSLSSSHHLPSCLSSLSSLSHLSLCLVLSSFEAALSLLLRGGSVSLPVLRSDALALLRGFMLFTLALWRTGIWESSAAGLANTNVRMSVNEVSCVHAAPPKCKRSAQIARTLCVC